MSPLTRAAALCSTGVPMLVLDSLVEKLNDLRRTSTLEYALRIGRLIVAEIYNDDLTRWRAHREHESSFRQLAARTQVDLKMSVTTLYRAVALYDLCSRLSIELWRDFGAGHLRAVLGLPEREQIRLLSTAKVETWSARELYEHALKARGRSVPSRRTAVSPVVLNLRKLLSFLKESFAPTSMVEIELVRQLIGELRAALDRLEQSMVLGAENQHTQEGHS